MNKIIEDIKAEGFTAKECVLYGILAPALVFMTCALSELITK